MAVTVPAAVIGALVPGVFWLWFFTRGRAYRPTPRRWLAYTFFFGALSTIPAGAIEFFAIQEDIEQLNGLGSLAIVMLFIVGPVEETSKFLAVRLGVARTRFIEEPLDALTFGVAASLGFATAENIVYALSFGPEVLVGRGVFSAVGHVVFGSIWAVLLVAPHGQPRRRLQTVAGIGGAAVLHGVFNVLVLSGSGLGALVAALLVLIGGVFVVRLFRWSRRVSRFRLGRNVPTIDCSVCGTRYRLGPATCPVCGTYSNAASSRLMCGRCGHQATSTDARFCGRCGDLFVSQRRA